jgi:hypothetical protein
LSNQAFDFNDFLFKLESSEQLKLMILLSCIHIILDTLYALKMHSIHCKYHATEQFQDVQQHASQLGVKEGKFSSINVPPSISKGFFV